MAFCVAFNTPKSLQYPGFDTFTVDVRSEFNLSSGVFRAPKGGIYVIHISANAWPTWYMDVYLEIDGQCHADNDLSYNKFPQRPETSGRAFMMKFESGWISRYKIHWGPIYSDNQGLQSSWTMFRLDDVMYPLISFSVTSTRTYITAMGIVPFDITYVNQGNGWNNETNEFIAPIRGTYFLSLTTQSYTSLRHIVEIQVNRVPLTLVTANNSNQFTDIFSNTFLVSLSSNDTVRIFLQEGYVGWGSVGFCDSLNFIGFLYKPIHGMQVAWSVHRTTSGVGPLEPFRFDYVMVNIGFGWSNANNILTVPISGVYYLNINANKVPSRKLNMQIMWNSKPYANLFADHTYHNGTETRGRAILTNLEQGDRLHIKLWNETEVYSDSYKQTSFSGFLLYPNY